MLCKSSGIAVFIVGKSNLMDAISFVFGEKTQSLRVKTVKVFVNFNILLKSGKLAIFSPRCWGRLQKTCRCWTEEYHNIDPLWQEQVAPNIVTIATIAMIVVIMITEILSQRLLRSVLCDRCHHSNRSDYMGIAFGVSSDCCDWNRPISCCRIVVCVALCEYYENGTVNPHSVFLLQCPGFDSWSSNW